MTDPRLGIHEEILLRLEVKDLIRYKSVCKSWNSLISSCRFINSHLNYTVKKKEDNNEIGDTRITALTTTSFCVDDCTIMRRHECKVVGSSNGLVCISHYRTNFLVVNPSTHEVKELRNPLEAYKKYRLSYVSGFGYDSSIDDYKVVIGFTNEYSKLVFEVLTLKSNVWRSVALESGYGSLYDNGIVWNGAIHWLSYVQNDKKVIVSFDLSKEVLKEIPLPKLGDRYVRWTLGTMKDCLCVFRFPDTNLEENEPDTDLEENEPDTDLEENEEIEIWLMRNYNVQVSWERKLLPPGYDANKITMEYYSRRIKPGHVHIWLLEEGSGAPVLVRSIERPHDRFDYPRNPHIRLSTNSECNYNFDEHVFVKSLVSPNNIKWRSYMEALMGNNSPPNDVMSVSTLYL